MRAAALLAAAVVGAPAALAAPPQQGILVVGRSLGGVRLGMSGVQVRRAWGPWYGVCRGCAEPTWYFNYARFQPQGAGVSFTRGRVDAIFTLWSPTGWRTTRGLLVGDDETRVAALYGALPRFDCGGYQAYTLVRRGTTTVFYVRDGLVYGFGLSRAAVAPCR